jgi:hypothetical protein
VSEIALAPPLGDSGRREIGLVARGAVELDRLTIEAGASRRVSKSFERHAGARTFRTTASSRVRPLNALLGLCGQFRRAEPP